VQKVIADVFKKAGVRPVKGDESAANAPDRLKDQGVTELEKEYSTWEDTLTPLTVDEVIMGNVLQSGQGQNPARQAMIYAGIPKETPAFTVNMVCASGLKAIALGTASIMTGNADVVVAGGQENMSLVPMALLKARWGHRMELTGTGDIYDLMVFDGLFETFYGYHMGITAENIVSEYGITRKEQDELGSGISLGHPIGCTGARQVVTGMYQMQRKGYQTGLVTMCIGGGMGMAMVLER
jgi:acetyl-CoA C-acetyltransferase